MTDDSSRPRYQTAGAVLDGLREQLKETPQDEMKLLLKIFKDLKTLDTDKMSPRDASLFAHNLQQTAPPLPPPRQQ